MGKILSLCGGTATSGEYLREIIGSIGEYRQNLPLQLSNIVSLELDFTKKYEYHNFDNSLGNLI